MLVRFFLMLRAAGVPATITEFLTLLEAVAAGIAAYSADEFYWLARATLVKDERHYDRFDRVFAAHFRGAELAVRALLEEEIPADWLRRSLEPHLSGEDMARIASHGGWDALMETLRSRLAEQRSRHEGGNRWIGTGGISPHGAHGINAEGTRFGSAGGGGQAVKLWERREFANLDDSVELGTRNVKLALRRLRRFAREGAALELDLDGTIDGTARRAGLLDVRMVPERHNAAKVLLFLDVGGSMDEHVTVCDELFSAARGEFKHLEHFYFHNFVYESVWRDNSRRHRERIPLVRIMRTYGRDYRLVLVGDATMSPYEILQAGGSIEHWNEEPGEAWMRRLLASYPRHAWLNPEPTERWELTPSIRLTRELVEERMFPLTLEGLDRAMRSLQ